MRDLDATSKPLDALWRAPTIGWVLLAGEVLAAVLALAPGNDQVRWIYFGLTSLVVEWVAMLTLGTLYLLRKPLVRLRPIRLAYCALVLLLLNTWAVSGVAWWQMRWLWPMSQTGWGLLLQLSGIVLAVGLLGLAAFQNHWQGRLHAVQAKQSELEALHARIRPHFLFNTLNTGAALIQQQPQAAERLLLDLADLFRAALAGPHEITLQSELSLTRRYLEIEMLRFGERLQVHWKLPSDLPQLMVPALSIQPLVENAIRHGIERMPDGGDLEVAVLTNSDVVVVRISNPVPSVVSGALQSGYKVGLSASQMRIKALTGGRGSVQTQTEGSHYITTVTLPRSSLPQATIS